MAEAAEPIGRINPLNKLFFELGKQLNAGEVRDLKELLSGRQLKKEEAEKVETAGHLFNLLKEKGVISEEDLDLLEELFETIDRLPLKDKVIKFQQNRDARRKRNACELKIKISSNDDRLKIIFFGSEVQLCSDHHREGAPQKIEVHLQRIEGLSVVEFRDGCIECVVKCETIAALETLWSQYKSGELQEVFQKAIITDELLKSLHAEYITMEVTISEEEYRKCREEVKAREELDKARQEFNKAIDEFRKADRELDKTYDEWYMAKQEVQKSGKEVQKSGKERHDLEAAEEEKKKAEQKWREADKGWIAADEELGRKWKAWTRMEAAADDLEAANIPMQTIKADAEEQTEKLRKTKEADVFSEQLESKGGSAKELKAKSPFKSEEEVNDEIRKLKSELERGFTRGDEKDSIKKQISSLEASKNTLREYLKLQSDTDSNIIEEKLQIGEERELFHEKEDKSEKESEVVKGISEMKIGRSGKHT